MQYNGFTLYRLPGPWKLLDSAENLYSDGWAPARSAWTYYKAGGPGNVVVDVRRTGFTGPGPPGHVTVTVGTVRLNDERLPGIGRVLATRHLLIHNGEDHKVTIPVKETPVRVRVDVTPTFKPSASDTRDLGAQLSFAFDRAGR
jgi:hypothetical protein